MLSLLPPKSVFPSVPRPLLIKKGLNASLGASKIVQFVILQKRENDFIVFCWKACKFIHQYNWFLAKKTTSRIERFEQQSHLSAEKKNIYQQCFQLVLRLLWLRVPCVVKDCWFAIEIDGNCLCFRTDEAFCSPRIVWKCVNW